MSATHPRRRWLLLHRCSVARILRSNLHIRGLGARLTLAVGVALVVNLVVLAAPAAAHPLGNFTTNTSATLLVQADGIEVIYVLDLAEIPTQQTASAIADAGGEQTWAAEECRRIVDTQSLQTDGATIDLIPEAAAITLPEGEAGLQTLRLTCSLSAATSIADDTRIVYADEYVPDRAGWREVVALGDGTTVGTSDVPSQSATDQLREYPDAEVSRITSATLRLDSTQGEPAPASLRSADFTPVPDEPSGGLAGLVESYTDLIARQDLTIGFVLLALVLAVLLGTAHAVAPGHGKTVIAAYLLGEGGQARQALALGGTVAVTHTVGVLLLGLVVQTSTTVAPESLYPILGAVGGVLFAGLGLLLLYRALRSRGHGHSHDHHHSHGRGHHHDDNHGHSHDGQQSSAPTWRMLVLPGLAGGMVPSPSALLVLLGGVALGRTWFGVILVMAYGVGMALALVGAGYLLHRLRFRVMERLESPTWARISAALPVATSSLIVVGGLVIVARSVVLA